jgi:hypothetical protein
MKPNNFLAKSLLILWMMMVVPATLSAYIYNMYIDDATSVTEGDQAGEKNMLFNVRIGDLAPAGGVGFTYTIVGSGNFSTISGSGTILYNQSSATITVPLPGDLIVEVTETLTATIASTGNTIPDPTATGTVYDNDTRYLTINSPSAITEGTNAVFTVTLTDNTASVDLPFTFTTTGSTVTLTNDYTVSSYGGTIPVNQSSTTITIPTVDDSDVEGSENLNINLVSTNPPLGTLNSGTITINDNDLYGITIASDANNSVAEGNVSSRNATYKVTINQAHTADITVHWALSGGATNPADAADFVSGLIFGDLTFTSGQTEQIITIPIKGDTTAEQNEKYTVTLSSPSANATLLVSSVDGTINNDDSGTVSILQSSSSVAESAGTNTYTIRLSAVPTGPVTVYYKTNNGTAFSGNDFTGVNTSVTYAAGDPVDKTFTVSITDDSEEEASQSFDVNITSATGVSLGSPLGVTTTITDNDGRTLSILHLSGTSTSTVEENTTNPTVSYKVKLSGQPLNNVKVNYALTHTSTDNADFLFTTYPQSGYLIFTPSDFADKTVTFKIHGDTDAEADQTYKITITSADANATVESGKGEVTGTITNDDSPILYFDPLSYSITEGNSGTKDLSVTVKLSGAISSDVTFYLKTLDGTATSAANDYTTINSSSTNSIKRRTIAPGDTNTTFTIKIKGDTTPEPTESFSVGLYNATGNATISSTDGNATITINDNDLAQVQIATLPASSVVEGNSGTTYADFNVTIDKSPSSNVDVNYSVTGAAVNGTDFVGGVLPTNITVQFLSGTTTLYQTIKIPIQGDTTLEGNEDFTVTLNSASGGATLGTTKTATGTILNDDTNVSAITDPTVVEPPCPTDTTYADLTVTLAQAVNYPVKIYYETQNGTAKAGSDYTSANTYITINSGTTGHILIAVNGDTNNSEGSETFKVNLTSAEDNFGNPIAITDANATVTITDNLDYNITGFIGGSVVEGDVNGTQHIAFTIDYCKPLTVAKTLNIAYSTTTATQNVDYNATLASITIPAHLTNTSYTFDISVYGDLITEVPDETFDLTLSGTNVNLTDNTARGTIIDDDDRTIDINSTSVIEGNTGNTTATLRIHMSKAAGAPVRVNYSTANGSATIGNSDYTARSYYVDFAANDATDKYVDFNVTGDYTVEGNETFTVNISTPNGVTISNPPGTITILDDDNGTLTLGGTTTYIEGNVDQDINLTVTFSGSPVARTIYYYTTAGSASVGSDFVNVPNTTAVVIPISTTPITVNLPITLKGDTLYELDENFTVTITSPDGFKIVNSPMQIKIIDDDGNLSINNPPAILEGDVGDKNITFNVHLSRDMNTSVTVNIAYTNDGATNPDDYTPIVNTLTFGPHIQDRDFNVTIHGDTAYEAGAQRFKATITSTGMSITNNGSGVGVGIGTITDDDARKVTISTNSYLENEINQTRTFSIDLNQSMENDLVLTYTTVDGAGTNKAVAGSDYNGTSGTLTIGHGQTHASVDVTVYGDYVNEADEDFNLSVSTVTPGINFTGGKMTITNDDGNLSIIASVDRNETNSSSFTMPFRVTLTSHPATGSPIYVNYATIDQTAKSIGSDKDFDATSGTLTFAPGQTYQDINVTVYGDNVIEGDEYFDLNITNTQGVIVTNNTSRGNIRDDDGRVISVVNKSVSEGDQGTITSYVTLHLSEISGSDANVSYTLSSTTAIPGVDYNATGGSTSILHGIQDVTIPIQHYGDLTFEPDENITITISSLTTGFTTPIATGILTLANDDGVLTIGDTSIQEGNVSTVTPGSILVTLSRVSTLPIDVNVNTINNTATAGADYNATVSQIFTIDANTTTVSIPLAVFGDNANEGNEYFTVRITNDQNVTIDDGDGNVTIIDSYVNDMTTYPQYQRDFTRRFYVNTYGNFVATGAPIMCAQVSDTNTSCDWNRNDYLATATTKFLNDDTSTSVKNSSSATLNITMETGDKILWAGLYWQGHVESTNPDGLDSNTSGWNTIQFKTPNGIVTPKTADLGDRNATNMYYFKTTSIGAPQPGFRFFYQGFVDVTNEVNASLTSNPGTTFTVGGMTASVGADHDINDPSHILSAGPPIVYGSGNVGHFGGWSLVVVREKADKTNPDDLHNISIFDGYKYLVAGASNPVSSIDINVSGFRTPKSIADGETIDSQLLYFGGGSEKKIANDELSISNKSGVFNTVSDANNPANNPLNDTIGVNGINIDSTRIYNPGIDLDSIQVGQHLETNQSSTTIRLTANYAGVGSDQAFAGLVGFSTQLYQPQLCYDFTFQQNGVHLKNVVGERDIPTIQGRVIQNDPITAGIYLKNVDSDFQIYGLSLFTDMNASKIHYTSPSARVSRVNGVTYGSILSENTGSCDYESGSATQQACHNNPNVRIGLGNNATGWSHDTAGSLNSGDFVFGQFDLNPDGMSGDVNESLNLQVSYYIDFENEDGTASFASYPSNKLGQNVKLCPAQTAYLPQWGQFNVVDHNTSSNYNLYTQASKKPFNVDVAFYGKDASDNYTALPSSEMNTTVLAEIIDVDAYHDINASCSNPAAAISAPIFVRINATPTDNTQLITPQSPNDYNFAIKNAAYRIWWFDNGGPDHTALAVNWTANAGSDNKVSALSSISGLFTPLHTLCATASTCGTNGENNSSNACFECLKDYYTHPICSRDNFSIRPEAFDLRIRDLNQTTLNVYPRAALQNISEDTGYIPSSTAPTGRINLTSGYVYRYDLNATNNVDVGGTPGYTRYFTGASTDFNATIDWNSTKTGCNDMNGATLSFDVKNGSMLDGNSSFDQIGEYKVGIIDRVWTAVDWRDIGHHTAGFLSGEDCTLNSNSVPVDSNITKVGCNITSDHAQSTSSVVYRDPLITFHPYQFDLSTIQFTRGTNNAAIDTTSGARNFLYMADINDTRDANMSFQANGAIGAMNFKGVKVSNFVTDCYAKDINISINRTMPDQNMTGYQARLVDSNGSVLYDSNVTVIPSSTTRLFALGEGNFTTARAGDTNTSLSMNYDRNASIPVNPLRVEFSDYTVTCQNASECEFAADDMSAKHTEGTKAMGFGVTHYYGRAQGVGSRIKTADSNTATAIGNVRVNFEIFCGNDSNTTCDDAHISLLPNGVNTPRGEDLGWYKNRDHNMTSPFNDGVADSDANITHKGAGNITANITLQSGGNINVTATEVGFQFFGVTYDGGKGYPHTTIMQNDPSHWLLYSPTNSNAALNEFTLEFYKPSKWVGENKANFATDPNDSDASVNPSRRIMW